MTRLPDWEPRLAATLAAWSAREHGWAFTCGDFAADVVEAVTGRDVRASSGLPVRSARALAGLFRDAGAKSLTDAVSATLGEPVGRRMVGRGDIVEAAHDMALGVCVGPSAMFLKDHGLITLPMLAVGHGWRL